ncbi:uncharacterized protein N7483_003105 [Penicillium malachiteum]|uniref:uncharacterized protein n=1 Tax=Penicillium malachiteum TaxID=1324776 RepID=UPI002546A707|nr:uncharacterized protein N7483_003105 [Penicillium malachiteum]KAJ5728597.1 hypothetical protein N7483_003105 [Penicillium malachiteum]
MVVEREDYKDLSSGLSSVPQIAFNASKRTDVPFLPDKSTHLLRQIREWANSRDEKHIFWLSGGPESEKTLISRIVAREFHDKGCLAASFFFSSGDIDAGHLGKFVTSIAFQLTEYSAALKDSINECIMEEDDISRKDWRHQWGRLISGGLYRSVTNLNSHQPLIIIIDALDEYEVGDHDIRELLSYISSTSSTLHREAVRLRFFITTGSRPSNRIQAAFDKISVTQYDSFALDDDFMEIVPYEGQLPLPLDNTNPAEPRTEALTLILRNCTKYCHYEEERAVLDSTLREVLSTSLVLFAPLPIFALAETIEKPRSSIENILSNLRPLGLSLSDFLNIQSWNDLGLRVDEKEAHGLLAGRCIQLMVSKLKKSLCDLDTTSAGLVYRNGLEDYIPAELRYACCYWIQHLYQSNFRDKSGQIFYFLHRHFLHWFEALALLQKTRDGIHAINLLESMTEVFQDLCTFICYMKKFALRYHSIAEKDPLQIYTSTITVHHEKSRVQRLFKDQVPKWICLSTNARNEWNSMLYQLEGHSDAIVDFAFCCDGLMESFYFGRAARFLRNPSSFDKPPFPSGKMTLAVSADGTKLVSPMFKIVQLDTVVCQIEQEYSFQGERVALSPDGSQTASTDKSNLVLIWESDTGHVQQILDGTSPRSHVSTKVCDCDSDWQTGLLQWVSAGLVQILGSHISVAVSGDGIKLAGAGCRFPRGYFPINGQYGQSSGLIRLWNPNAGQIKQTFNFDTTEMLDDSGEDSELPYAIKIWDISTGEVKRIFHYNYKFYPVLAFSPDCSSLAIALGSHIRIYDLNNGQMEEVFGGHSSTASRISTMKFSPDGSKLISGSEDTIIRVWEVGVQQKSKSRPHSSILTALRQWTSQGDLMKPIMIDLPAN